MASWDVFKMKKKNKQTIKYYFYLYKRKYDYKNQRGAWLNTYTNDEAETLLTPPNILNASDKSPALKNPI